MQLRIGLNSGQVIAGEIGSGAAGYTTIGKHVGMGQRMESAAPPGGVMLSESTARLVDKNVVLGERKLVYIKNLDAPVAGVDGCCRSASTNPRRRDESKLVGRTWELNTITGILDEAINGAGCVVGVVGPPGIGKSRLTRERDIPCGRRGVDVFATYLRIARERRRLPRGGAFVARDVGGEDLDAGRPRTDTRPVPDANPEDLLLLDDLLGIRDADSVVPDIAADARRRRLTAMINAAALARTDPAVLVIEDAHWIDESSESMLAAPLPIIPQTHALVLITYRPEYQVHSVAIPRHRHWRCGR